MSNALEQAREHFLQGVEHFEADRLDQARLSFEAALALAPGRASVLGNLGITLFRMRDYRGAVPVLRQAVDSDAGNGEAWIALGLSHESLGEWTSAAEALQRGVALEGAQPTPWFVLGQCQARLGNESEALRALERAIEIEPAFGAAWSAKGGLLRDMYRLPEAAQCYERAIELGEDPELNGYFVAAALGKHTPAAPPRRYVEGLFDDYAGDFNAHLVEHLGYRGHEWLLRPLIESGAHYPATIDLGCGTGLCGPLIAAQSARLTGVDLSAAMLDRARATGTYHELVHADLAEFLARPGLQADLVIAADVFIYVGDLDEVFAGVRRALKPGGCFAFTVELPPDDADGFRLLPSLRYGHSEAYVREMAARHRFEVRDITAATLRQHQSEPMPALYVYLG